MFRMTSSWQQLQGEDDRDAAATSQRLRAAVRFAVRAPSGHNAQPWLFKVGEDRIELFCDHARALPAIDPDDREMIIGCGAALMHLRIALGHFGFAFGVDSFPEPAHDDLVAWVNLTGRRDPTEEERALFDAILRRHTYRLPFEPIAVRESVLSGLRHSAAAEGAFLHVIRGAPARLSAAELIASADRIQLRDPQVRRELAQWIRPADAPQQDGIPPSALGMSRWGDALEGVVRFAMGQLNLGLLAARRDRRLALGSPVLAVLGTPSDTRADWVTAGQALARVLLRAARAGLSASFFNQAIEVPAIRQRLRALVGGRGWPQILLRLGYGREIDPTPRRPLQDVLLRRAPERAAENRE